MDVETLLASLRAGQLPAPARQWLIEGLEAWLHGAELEQALGLVSEPLDRRDDLLRVVLELTPGDSDAARCSFLIECLAGRKHPSPTAAQLLDKLLESGVLIPRSIKHLRRILLGSRQDSGTGSGWLCPCWPAPQNSSNYRGKTNERRKPFKRPATAGTASG